MKAKVVRITTVAISLRGLLRGQLRFMNQYFEVIGIASPGAELDEVRTSEGIRTYAVPMTRTISPFRDLIALVRLVRIFRRERPDIVHTHTPKAGTIGMLAAWICRVPVRMHTVAGLPLLERAGNERRLLNIVEKLTYKFATRVYPNSFGLMEIILTNGYAKRPKVKVIGNGSSNGIDAASYSLSEVSDDAVTRTNSLCGITSGDFVYVFIGRVVKDKGIEELVSAFTKLNARFDNSLLVVIGTPEQELNPIGHSTDVSLRSHPRIRLVGEQKDVRPFLAVSKVLVLPTYREGLPNVPMQACAMGIPCIVTNVNGCNEIIQHEHNGLIVRAKDTNDLHSAMERIMIDRELYEGLASNARESVCTRYEQKNLWRCIKAEYDEYLENMNGFRSMRIHLGT